MPTPPTARLCLLHLMAFVLPVSTLAFSLSGPHEWWTAALFLLPLLASVVADMRSPGEYRQPVPDLPGAPFDAIVLVLTGLQVVNVVLLARLVSLAGFWSTDTLVAVVLGGINSGYSGIVVAHELIHRASPRMQLLGRLLMSTVLYEHFCTEHVRGHHARVGTPEDPATARFGETYRAFYVRTLPAQFRSAWELESRRLGVSGPLPVSLWHRHRVVQGLAFEWGFAFALLAVFGPGAFVAHLLQARQAVDALEAVNYFEHWGIARASRKVRPVDSWDTDSRFSLYTLVGLSRHADHHAHASRQYQQLRHWQESPKLPYGYFGMVMLVWFRNDLVRRMLTRELKRRGLGPFAGGRGEEERREAAESHSLHGALAGTGAAAA